ncbi:uncharacterized protein LOC110729968 [Chenopodium quinoa]|uniref:uncharacterized protein LOC110729968 n=1 Tax=Chenopodium quinoa TaxID=63459 RepID=UPI000B77892E|nr:uncharacterized protein LOC110729968 [Chenopodium quinoa]
MIVLSWNIRGLNDPGKVASVRKLLSDQKCDVLCLIETKDRLSLWAGLRQLTGISGTWLCAGDFNSTLCCEDRINGAVVTDYETRNFQNFIDDLALTKIKSKGSFFSWCNKAHNGPRTYSRIDRGIVNQDWMDTYGHVEAIYLPPYLSDHNPILFDIIHSQPGKGRPFRFLNYLADHESFLDIVDSAWQCSVPGNAMHKVWSKLKQVKTALKAMNIEKFGNVSEKVEAAQNALTYIQQQIIHDV